MDSDLFLQLLWQIPVLIAATGFGVGLFILLTVTAYDTAKEKP